MRSPGPRAPFAALPLIALLFTGCHAEETLLAIVVGVLFTICVFLGNAICLLTGMPSRRWGVLGVTLAIVLAVASLIGFVNARGDGSIWGIPFAAAVVLGALGWPNTRE